MCDISLFAISIFNCDALFKTMMHPLPCFTPICVSLCRYDADLKATPPPDFGSPQLHYFEDWGVVTWGGALPGGRNHTFLSFKSGKLGGRAIFDIVHQQHYSEWIQGWKNFNAGHEHPDQNSFTFAPGGFPFITEGLYGPKYTLLNNALMFAPSLSGDCFSYWEGQVTESCDSKWSKYKSGAAADCEGRVEAALERMGVVFIRGEGRASYDPALKIRNLQRNLVLLLPDLLLLLDHVHLDSESPVHTMSAFFHNTDFPFQQTKSHGVHGALIQNRQDVYTMLWQDDHGESRLADTSYFSYPHGYPFNGSHFVNVTTPLGRPHTRVAYIFFGPGVEVQSFSMRGDSERVVVYLTTQDHTFTVHILTSQNPSKPLFAMVLMDQKYKIVFEHQAGMQERPLEVVKDYVNVVQHNLQLIKPVFQLMESRVQGRILNPEGLQRIFERMKNSKKKKKKKTKKKATMAMEKILSVKERINNSIKMKVESRDNRELFSWIKEREKSKRVVKQKSDSRGFGENSDVYWHKQGEVVRGRVFNKITILEKKGVTDASVSVSYIRLFLVVNMATFFLLLAVLLTQFQRAPSLQTQRCIYCILLLDSFVLLSLYSSCSRGHC